LLVDDARLILAAWQERLLTEDDVREWSYQVLDAVPAAELPEWLLDLSTSGPSACMSRPSSDFLNVPRLDYLSGLSLRLRTCDFANPAELDDFIAWTSRACMGEDLDKPEVRFGYQLDHYLNDCTRLDLARDHVAKELPALQEQAVPMPERVIELVSRSKLRTRKGGG
jgi:hypothetical protein